MSERIVQTAGRDQLGKFAPMFAHLNDDVLFGEVWNSPSFIICSDRFLWHVYEQSCSTFSIWHDEGFCSHGGGRFGQSLTAIAKLAPDADMGEGLSVHYSGGSTLSEDIQNWLDINGINK